MCQSTMSASSTTSARPRMFRHAQRTRIVLVAVALLALALYVAVTLLPAEFVQVADQQLHQFGGARQEPTQSRLIDDVAVTEVNLKLAQLRDDSDLFGSEGAQLISTSV
eukprot:Opistho-2@86794